MCPIMNRYIATSILTCATVSENLTIRIINRYAQHKETVMRRDITKKAAIKVLYHCKYVKLKLCQKITPFNKHVYF
jgi:hypothetical protein